MTGVSIVRVAHRVSFSCSGIAKRNQTARTGNTVGSEVVAVGQRAQDGVCHSTVVGHPKEAGRGEAAGRALRREHVAAQAVGEQLVLQPPVGPVVLRLSMDLHVGITGFDFVEHPGGRMSLEKKKHKAVGKGVTNLLGYKAFESDEEQPVCYTVLR